MESLGVNPTAGTATFISKANLTDVTNPNAPIGLGGNLKLKITMDDNGEPGVNDLIGITLRDNNNNLLYASNTIVNSQAAEMLLAGGNLVVHSSFNLGPLGPQDPPYVHFTDNTPPALKEQTEDISLRVYPNPFQVKTKVEFVVPADTRAIVEVFSLMGKKVKTLFDGTAEANRRYSLDFECDSSIPAGTFICVIRTEYGTKNAKLILTK